MDTQRTSRLGLMLGWLAFPLVPALLENAYHALGGFSIGTPDPRDWDTATWVIQVGPLLGYGFLAGATLDVADDPARRGLKSWRSRRAVWVAVGPWVGFLAWAALYFGVSALATLFPRLRDAWPTLPPWWRETWLFWVAGRLALIVVIGTFAYGWLFVAWAALRRAARAGLGRRAFRRGVAVAAGFVGSLFGSFWAATEVWRAHFFDPRLVPLVLAAASVGLLGGCDSTPTYGEVRRRALFDGLLPAWVIGLALCWWWASRPRGRRP